jgi:uncharacterized membrane protein YbhN (UPF0104 family)
MRRIAEHAVRPATSSGAVEAAGSRSWRPAKVPDDHARQLEETGRGAVRWPLGAMLVVIAVAAAFLAIPALAAFPARLIQGCGAWIATAGALEVLSGLGFVVFFKLVFAGSMGWRRTTPAALRALGASTVLPGGPLIGPTAGAWSTSTEKPSLSQLARSTITFVILVNAPGAIVLAALGTLLWLGLPSGSHHTALTILPAVIAVGLLVATWLAGGTRERPARRGRRGMFLAKPAGALSDGLAKSRALVTAGNWKLVGAVAYYAFDNAVLWAAFRAYGHSPKFGVVVMGYLVGSLAGALPIPAGLGVLEGGLIGALVLYGAPAAPAAAAVLLYRGISLSVPVMLGTLGCARRPKTRPHRLDRRRAPRRAVPELSGGQPDGPESAALDGNFCRSSGGMGGRNVYERPSKIHSVGARLPIRDRA